MVLARTVSCAEVMSHAGLAPVRIVAWCKGPLSCVDGHIFSFVSHFSSQAGMGQKLVYAPAKPLGDHQVRRLQHG